jgi:hypothetical protein
MTKVIKMSDFAQFLKIHKRSAGSLTSYGLMGAFHQIFLLQPVLSVFTTMPQTKSD